MSSEQVLDEMAIYVGKFAASVQVLLRGSSVGNAELACLASRSVQGVVLPDWQEFKLHRRDDFERFVSCLDEAIALMENLAKSDDPDEQFHLDHAIESTSRRRKAFGLLLDFDDEEGALDLLKQATVECV